jgi:hypothetical protein
VLHLLHRHLGLVRLVVLQDVVQGEVAEGAQLVGQAEQVQLNRKIETNKSIGFESRSLPECCP